MSSGAATSNSMASSFNMKGKSNRSTCPVWAAISRRCSRGPRSALSGKASTQGSSTSLRTRIRSIWKERSSTYPSWWRILIRSWGAISSGSSWIWRRWWRRLNKRWRWNRRRISCMARSLLREIRSKSFSTEHRSLENLAAMRKRSIRLQSSLTKLSMQKRKLLVLMLWQKLYLHIFKMQPSLSSDKINQLCTTVPSAYTQPSKYRTPDEFSTFMKDWLVAIKSTLLAPIK